MKYRKKPVVIEAFRMTKDRRANDADWPEWMRRAWHLEPETLGSLYPTEEGASDGTLSIGTFEGQILVSWDDWIIQGTKGELYVCKPDVFEATYEACLSDEGNETMNEQKPQTDKMPAGAAARFGTWLPIDTAPKDGTRILLAGGKWGDDLRDDRLCVMVAWWEQHRDWRFWNTCAAEGGYSMFPYSNPTHWMPLPEAPNAELTDASGEAASETRQQFD